MADCWLDSSSDEDDWMGEAIDALYLHVVRRHEEVSETNFTLGSMIF